MTVKIDAHGGLSTMRGRHNDHGSARREALNTVQSRDPVKSSVDYTVTPVSEVFGSVEAVATRSTAVGCTAFIGCTGLVVAARDASGWRAGVSTALVARSLFTFLSDTVGSATTCCVGLTLVEGTPGT